jgi:hypothetical protein
MSFTLDLDAYTSILVFTMRGSSRLPQLYFFNALKTLYQSDNVQTRLGKFAGFE